jgi:hypothetical protein
MPDLATPSDSAAAGYCALKKSEKCESCGLAAGWIACELYAKLAPSMESAIGGIVPENEIRKKMRVCGLAAARIACGSSDFTIEDDIMFPDINHWKHISLDSHIPRGC